MSLPPPGKAIEFVKSIIISAHLCQLSGSCSESGFAFAELGAQIKEQIKGFADASVAGHVSGKPVKKANKAMCLLECPGQAEEG